MIVNNRYEVASEEDMKHDSKVIMAKDLITNRLVVLKKCAYQGLGLSIEKEILQKVSNEHLPFLIDQFTLEDVTYLVMNQIEGETLKALTETSVLDEGQLIDYIWQLCEVVSYLHEHPKGIVHGDITPQNIIVNSRRHLTLIDFGAALMMDDHSVDHDDYTSVGTVGYAAPENILYPEMSGWQSDLYGIGAILKQCLKHYNDIYSMELSIIAQKATAIKPEHRYRNIQQMKEDLQLLL